MSAFTLTHTRTDDINSLFLIDFYKVSHVSQYPKDVTQIWSNWTPRKSRIPEVDRVTFFGLQYFIQRYLLEHFNQNFFHQPLKDVLGEYKLLILSTLGDTNPRTDHIEWLHKLGYLPIEIYALPEGVSSKTGIPQLVITNTEPEGFWLPNYLETILSNILWKPSTSATTAKRYRKIFEKWAKKAGETDFSFIDWQGHDFSFRGMSGVEDAVLSGMGHLTQFSGTDTIPAIIGANRYYDAALSCGGSVPATEHSVMSAGSQDGELETFRRLLTEVHPKGIVSVVSDTWDLWKVCTEYVPALKDVILARDGKLVIRPDSGDPVKILTGDFGETRTNDGGIHPEHNYCTYYHPARLGVLRLLRDALGVTPQNNGGLPLINKAAAIYGDSITPERADDILNYTTAMGLSPYNVVLGIGSFTYEYVTRDTYGFAMKATAYRNTAGEVIPIFKNPVTDSGMKKSCKGIPVVYRTEESTEEDPDYFLVESSNPDDLDRCEFRKVFSNGIPLVFESFDVIRARARK